ncbi:MAG: DEAD/DEAH box helicase [Clostridiales bacterium]|nr:DEAD/DEAH box helicase [Clostridiales bacterium]
MQFNEIKLLDELMNTIKEIGYSEATPIQSQTIPLLLEGYDVLACAQTGTGKTAAYVLPMLHKLSGSTRKKIKGLILTPTRELANQIHENIKQFGKGLGLSSTVIYGGVGQNAQVNALKSGVDILVATPGRLNDLIDQGYIKLGDVEMFVLDEADQMLDLGFIHDMKKIIPLLPKNRQTLLFSATMPKEIEKLASTILKSPQIIKVDPVTSTVEAINQTVYFVDRTNKISLLTYLIKEKKMTSVLVFTRTKIFADKVALKLNKAKITAMAIHGDKGQSTRELALRSFKDGSIKVLVATDVAARGIDIAELNYVINYDIPDTPETYIHRIGRTGRAGYSGNAINFCNYDDIDCLRDIEKHIGKIIKEIPSQWPMLILEKSERKARNQVVAKSENNKPKHINMQGKEVVKNKERHKGKNFNKDKVTNSHTSNQTTKDKSKSHGKSSKESGRSHNTRATVSHNKSKSINKGMNKCVNRSKSINKNK